MAEIRASQIGLETRREVECAARDVRSGVLARADDAVSGVAEFRASTARPVGAQYAVDALCEAIVQMVAAGGAFAPVVVPGRKCCAAHDWRVMTVVMVYMMVMVDLGERQEQREYCDCSSKGNYSQPPCLVICESDRLAQFIRACQGYRRDAILTACLLSANRMPLILHRVPVMTSQCVGRKTRAALSKVVAGYVALRMTNRCVDLNYAGSTALPKTNTNANC